MDRIYTGSNLSGALLSRLSFAEARKRQKLGIFVRSSSWVSEIYFWWRRPLIAWLDRIFVGFRGESTLFGGEKVEKSFRSTMSPCSRKSGYFEVWLILNRRSLRRSSQFDWPLVEKNYDIRSGDYLWVWVTPSMRVSGRNLGWSSRNLWYWWKISREHHGCGTLPPSKNGPSPNRTKSTKDPKKIKVESRKDMRRSI